MQVIDMTTCHLLDKFTIDFPFEKVLWPTVRDGRYVHKEHGNTPALTQYISLTHRRHTPHSPWSSSLVLLQPYRKAVRLSSAFLLI